MKKLKKIWQENSVLFVLFSILIICLVAIFIVFVTYFVGGSKSKYGDRLDNIEKYPFNEKEIKELTTKIKENESIKDIEVRTSGKIIYLHFAFDSKVTLEEAKGIAIESLEYFDEKTLSFYDLQYYIKADSTDKTDGFLLMGARNSNGTGGISWNNNTQFEEKTDK